MLGANIERNVSPNMLKEDEQAYINRMKLHYRNQPKVRGSGGSGSKYGNISFDVSKTYYVYASIFNLS